MDLALAGVLNVDLNTYGKPLNAVIISNLLKAYRQYITPMIDKHKRETREAKYLIDKTPSKEEQNKISREAIVSSFEHFKNTGRILNFGNIIYKRLHKHLIEDDKELRPQAENIYRLRIETKLDRNEYKHDLIDTIKRIEKCDMTSNDEFQIQSIICDLKLQEFYERIIKMEMDIIDFIEDEEEI